MRTTTTNAELTDVHDMVVIHRVFRRELAPLPTLLERSAIFAELPVLARWYLRTAGARRYRRYIANVRRGG